MAVAEPRDDYREDFAHTHHIEERHRYRDWRDLFAASLPLDAVVVTTMDRDHTEPSLAALASGHHLLMEKPMAPSLEECERIAAAAADSPAITAVCHSLRYGRPFRLLKEVVSSGRIGTVVTVDHLEQVLWWHQAHSFVRGKWGNEGRSSFMLLAKSCHDVDYLAYLGGPTVPAHLAQLVRVAQLLSSRAQPLPRQRRALRRLRYRTRLRVFGDQASTPIPIARVGRSVGGPSTTAAKPNCKPSPTVRTDAAYGGATTTSSITRYWRWSSTAALPPRSP